MSHPYNDKRATKVEHARVPSITKGYDRGGMPHGDEAADKSLIRRMVKGVALRADGGAVNARADRPQRARGGPVKSKSKGTTVNVIVAPKEGGDAGPSPVPMAAPHPPIPMPPPRPPMMPPPGAMPPPGVGGPSPMPPRSVGGRAYARGGKVDANNAGIGKGRTPVQHEDNMADQRKDIGRKPVITKASGGPINANGKAGKQMGPKFSGGARGGSARLEKAARARKTYAKA